MSYEQRIIKSFKEDGAWIIAEKLRVINLELTGQDGDTFSRHRFTQLVGEIKLCLEGRFDFLVIHLGDSGLSRIVIGKTGEDINAQLSYNSTEKVKKIWESQGT